MEFSKTIRILSHEINKIKDFGGDASELQKAIQVLRDGKGYFTKEHPKKVVWFKDI